MVMTNSMRRALGPIAAAACSLALLLGGPAVPAAEKGVSVKADILVRKPDNITFRGKDGDLQTSLLFGDPKRAGLYAGRFKFPKGLKIMPHYHSDADRTVVVLSGTLWFSRGEQWDESKLVAFPAGTFYTEPKDVPHFAWAKDDDVVIQLTAIGPTGTTQIPQKPAPAAKP